MLILVATPTADRRIDGELYTSILSTVLTFGRQHPGVGFGFMVTEGAIISIQRNAAATRVLTDERFSHLLFVDSDMGFRPDLIVKMLSFDRPIVGCMTPNRRQAPVGSSASTSAASLEYVLEGALIPSERDASGRPRYRVNNGFVRVSALGAGIMLIRRSALQAMAAKLPALWTTETSPGYDAYDWCKEGVFQFFAPLVRPSGFYVGEDMAFCQRWAETVAASFGPASRNL